MERVEEVQRNLQGDFVSQYLVLCNGTRHWASNISVSTLTSGLQVGEEVLRKVSLVVADIPYGLTNEPWDIKPTKVCLTVILECANIL